MGGVSLIEFLKDVGTYLRGHPAAGIADPDHSVMVSGGEADGDSSPGRCKFKCVGEKIVPHQRQQLRIGLDTYAVGDIRFDLNVRGFPYIFILQEVLTELLAQIEFGGLGIDLLVFQPVQLQNIGHHIGKPLGGIGYGFPVFDSFFLIQTRLLKQCAVIAHNGQGRFHLMGHIGNKIRAQGLHAPQLLRHLIEARDHFAELLRIVVFRLDAHMEVALHDPFSRFRDPLHRPLYRQLSADPVTDCEQQAQQQYIGKGQLCGSFHGFIGQGNAEGIRQGRYKQHGTAADQKGYQQEKYDKMTDRLQYPSESGRFHFNTTL